jgi:hypothetical protein
MRIRLFILLVFTTSFCFAQRQADNLINGNCYQVQGLGDCLTPYANMVLKFNDDGLQEIIEPLNLGLAINYSRAAYSDADGNLAFASNGWRLVDQQGNVLSNRLYFDWVPWPGDNPDPTMVLNSLGPLFLNDPGNSNRAYLFYGQYMGGDFGPEIVKADVVFTYAYLDVPNRALISQNNIVMNDTSASGDMLACRHANGRDWWLIKPGIYEDEYYIGLLSPTGISEMQKNTIPGIFHRGQFETLSYFSFDGLKFLHYTGKRNKYLHEYDFDRCTGKLLNPVVHDLTDSIPSGDGNACTASPDGSKLYIRRSTWPDAGLEGAFLQYDLNSSNWTFLSSTITSSPQVTPNGKEILMQSRIIAGDTAYTTLSRILQPNLPGLFCNFVTHTDTLQNNPSFVYPSNFANFRLGPIDGSSCDTLGINSVESFINQKAEIAIYPNPAKEMITIRLLNTIPRNPSVYIYNSLGTLVYQCQFENAIHTLKFNDFNFSNGFYWMKIMNGDGSFVRKFMVE